MTKARLRPIRSPTLLPTRMNAADTSASSAIAPCTPLTVVSRSSTTFAIETFISDVSTTSTNIAIASSTARRRVCGVHSCESVIRQASGPSGRRASSGSGDARSELRDHEHGGQDGDRDASDGEHADRPEPQRDVPAGPQRMLEIALALGAGEQQAD